MHVTWEADGEKAIDVPVFVRTVRRGTPRAPLLSQRTNEDGIAIFDSLAPGEHRVTANRGTPNGTHRIEVLAGQTVDLGITLPVGVLVRGIVVDLADHPVAGAGIVVSGWGRTELQPLTTTDEHGRFELPGIGPGAAIGARARHHAPSLLHELTQRDGSKIELRIVLPGLGGSLVCTVLGSDGEPVSGATVRAGEDGRQHQPQKLDDGSWGLVIPQERLTDDRGEVRFEGVAAGRLPLAASASDHSAWRDTIDVIANRENTHEIRLEPAARLEGTVRDESGAPFVDFWLMVGGPGRLGTRSTRTDSEGSFRFENVPIGEFRIEVQGNGLRKTAKLVGIAGQTIRWDVKLPNTVEMQGQLVGPDDRPVPNTMIEGYVGTGWLHTATDDDGRFKLENVIPGERLRLTARPLAQFFPVDVFDGVPPTKGGTWILRIAQAQMPSIRIRGRLVSPRGEPVTQARLSPQRRGHGNTTEYQTDDDGRFDYGPYPPGEYRLIVRAKGWANVRTPWQKLGPHESADLGNVRLERPGKLVVTVTGGEIPEKLTFSIYDERGAYVERVNVRKGRGVAGGLPSGSYRLQVRGAGVVARCIPIAIHTERETPVQVEAGNGTPVKFSVTVAEGAKRPRRVGLDIDDARGQPVVRMGSVYVRDNGSLSTTLELAPGQYRIRGSAKELTCSTSIEIENAAGERPVELQLR